MSEYKVRAATREDLPTLLEFEQGIIKAERPYDPTLSPDPISYYDIGELIDSEEAEVSVVTFEDKIVASGYAKTRASKPYVYHDQHAFLGFMFVEPEHRGKGVNQLIVDELKDWARTKGLTEIRLEVYAENKGAIRAYAKADFNEHIVRMRCKLD